MAQDDVEREGSVKPKEVANRLTGFSTPFFGLQWTPAVLDREVAHRVMVFLGDRRVLFMPSAAEVPEHCVASVLEIRRFLTDALGQGGIAAELQSTLLAMRTACRQFVTTAGISQRGERVILPHSMHGPFGGPWLNQALGELRATMRIHLAQVSVAYDIDVPDELAIILPPPADKDPQ